MEEKKLDSSSRQSDFQDIEKATEEAPSAQVRADAATPAAWMTGKRAVAGVLATAFPVLAILLAVNVFGLSPVELIKPSPSPAIARRQTHEALAAMVEKIEEFREDHDELPGSLAEVAGPSPGTWTYSRMPDGRYRVVLEMHGEVVTFDSAQSKKVLDKPRP